MFSPDTFQAPMLYLKCHRLLDTNTQKLYTAQVSGIPYAHLLAWHGAHSQGNKTVSGAHRCQA